MIKQLLCTALVVLATATFAQKDSVKITAPIQEATVYFGYGAELVHKSKVNVSKSTKYIVLDNLSTQLDINSLQISCPENVSLLAQQYMLYTPPVKPLVVNALIKKQQDVVI